jgi:hypothetical protein
MSDFLSFNPKLLRRCTCTWMVNMLLLSRSETPHIPFGSLLLNLDNRVVRIKMQTRHGQYHNQDSPHCSLGIIYNVTWSRGTAVKVG